MKNSVSIPINIERFADLFNFRKLILIFKRFDCSKRFDYNIKIVESPSWIVGQTRQIHFVPEWDVVHHEILAISTPFQILTSSNIGERECELSHKLIGNYNLNYNTVKKIADFVQFCGNLFVTSSGLARLHNFLTKAFISHNAAEELQNFPQNSKLRYENFRQLRYIAKTKSLSATIKKFNFSHFGTSHKEKSKPSKKMLLLVKGLWI